MATYIGSRVRYKFRGRRRRNEGDDDAVGSFYFHLENFHSTADDDDDVERATRW